MHVDAVAELDEQQYNQLAQQVGREDDPWEGDSVRVGSAVNESRPLLRETYFVHRVNAGDSPLAQSAAPTQDDAPFAHLHLEFSLQVGPAETPSEPPPNADCFAAIVDFLASLPKIKARVSAAKSIDLRTHRPIVQMPEYSVDEIAPFNAVRSLSLVKAVAEDDIPTEPSGATAEPGIAYEVTLRWIGQRQVLAMASFSTALSAGRDAIVRVFEQANEVVGFAVKPTLGDRV